MLLAEIKKGQSAQITSVLPSTFREKLLEMGCIPGAQISLLMKAPFGDPMAFDVDGYCLSMRKNEAKKIEIKLVEIG